MADPRVSNVTPESVGEVDVIEIRDPEIDVEAIMARIRENVARRRAEGAYREDLDAIGRAAFDSVLNEAPMAGSDGASPMEMTLAELNRRWMVQEVPFQSQTRVIGPLLVAVRTLWNWVSTKWYVRAILQQQVGFNATVVRAMTEMEAQRQAMAQELRHVRELCQRQQEEIVALRQQAELPLQPAGVETGEKGQQR